MSIVEVVESDTGNLRRIEFWRDYKVQVVQTHTFSKMYEEKLYREMGEKPLYEVLK